MTAVQRGRFTVAGDRDVVVFLIGTRINSVHRVRAWAPVVTAMPRMLAELARDPDAGLLSSRLFLSGRTVLVRQYWQDTQHLLAYAAATDAQHLPAWRAFNRAVRDTDGAVGIFHETYRVPAGAMEAISVDMPSSGVLEALGSVPVTRSRTSARERLAGGTG